MNDIAVIEPQQRALSAVQVLANVQLVQKVMKSVMKKDVHYGVVPGTDKPTLLKPGAEVLLSTFQISVDPLVEDLSTDDDVRYRVRAMGTHRTSGIVMGIGVGECSSNEEKYKWRRAVCDEEFDDTPEDRRRTAYKRKGQGHYKVKQIRTEPSDVANTVLKMAKKRALVDFALTALAASDIFAQDLEDIPEGHLEDGDEPKRMVAQPRAKSAAEAEAQIDPTKKINEGQVKFLQKKLSETVTAEKLCAHFKIAALPDLLAKDINDVLIWIGEQTPE